MTRTLSAMLAAATLFAASGCLNNTYRIPRGELATLSQTAPADRGRRVRVVQGIGASEEPPGAPRVHGNTTIIVVGDGHHHHDPYRPPPTGGTGGVSGGTGTRPGGGKGPSAKLASDDSKAWIIIAVVAAVALATTEGARYDGWVQVHPMHPVHLYGPGGQYMWVPLAQLTPEQAAWAQRAYLRDTEGPWTPMGRAPLNRVGFTYSVLLGSSGIVSANGDEDMGFQGHIQFGFFPAQQLGLNFDIGLGWRQNELDLRAFDARYAFEIQAYPVAAGKLHLGLFGQGGLATHLEDGGPVMPGGDSNRDKGGKLYGAGLLGQLEITTRLALTARAGYVVVMGDPVTEFSLGLSIY